MTGATASDPPQLGGAASPHCAPLSGAGTIERLEAALAQNHSLSELLGRFDDLGLTDGWLVAGAIAQTVWNMAFQKPAESGVKDVDVVYFDADDLSAESEAAHERRLRDLFRRHCQLKPSWYALRVGGGRLGIWKR